MSTFDGFLSEFPTIRIDNFRNFAATDDHLAPLACFLSHVHSDHLSGLDRESFHGPFVYCSPATREILLRLERGPHRMNYNKGILESRVQPYKRLAHFLKTIPLETPTKIELSPKEQIRVTLFDANHCVGAVMFLIQGNGKAILYTGDIRAETWWVNSLVRNPILLPFTLRSCRLDRIYLDTTFATTRNIHRNFQPKADAVRDLIETVQRYPIDTTLYFHTWTFGYEEIWVALSNALNTSVHIDNYKLRIFDSLGKIAEHGPPCFEAPPLCGFKLANGDHKGCLTSDVSARIHSCEEGTSCPVHDADLSSKIVRIVPIINRTDSGEIVAEEGFGGGNGDLDQAHELVINNAQARQRLIELCNARLEHEDPVLLAKVIRILEPNPQDSRILLPFDEALISSQENRSPNLSLDDVIEILIKVARKCGKPESNAHETIPTIRDQALPNTIFIPYSRHSSYTELRELVAAFQPKDVYPCTVHLDIWDESLSMRKLFGDVCSENIFAYDPIVQKKFEEKHCRPALSRKRTYEEDEIQLNSSDIEESSQRTITLSPTKRCRSLAKSPATDSAEEYATFDYTQFANCATQVPLDEGSPENDLNSHVAEKTPPLYDGRQSDASKNGIALKHSPSRSPKKAVSRRNPPPQPTTPQPRNPQTPLDTTRKEDTNLSIPSSPPHHPSSPFDKAHPAPFFDTTHEPAPSPSTDQISPPQPLRKSMAKPQNHIPPSSRTPLLSSPPSDQKSSTRSPSSSFLDRLLRHPRSSSLLTRHYAERAALGLTEFSWWDFGGLTCVGNNHAEEEREL